LLQAVVAEPPAGCDFTFADIDLDLGNPLQDVVGFVVHMGELAPQPFFLTASAKARFRFASANPGSILSAC